MAFPKTLVLTLVPLLLVCSGYIQISSQSAGATHSSHSHHSIQQRSNLFTRNHPAVIKSLPTISAARRRSLESKEPLGPPSNHAIKKQLLFHQNIVYHQQHRHSASSPTGKHQQRHRQEELAAPYIGRHRQEELAAPSIGRHRQEELAAPSIGRHRQDESAAPSVGGRHLFSGGAKRRRAIWPPSPYASAQVAPTLDPATNYLNFHNSFSDDNGKKIHPGVRLLRMANTTNPVSPPSCTTNCHPPRHSPSSSGAGGSGGGHACGAWLHYDNAASATGTYLLNASMINLTCVIHSLPKPVAVEWVFQPTATDRPRSVEPVCTALRTITDCRVNSVGEHRVRSTCLKATNRLEDSGMYYCRVANHGSEELTSPATRVEVYGIESLDPTPLRSIDYNRTNVLELRICAHPAPQVLWINTETGVSAVAGGATAGNYTAMALYRVVSRQFPRGPMGTKQRNGKPGSKAGAGEGGSGGAGPGTGGGDGHDKYDPAQTHQYCYVSKLVIAKAQPLDRSFVAMVTNNVAARQVHYKLLVAGQPLMGGNGGPSSVRGSAVGSQLLFNIIITLLVLVGAAAVQEISVQI